MTLTRVHLLFPTCAVWALYKSLPAQPGTGLPSKNHAVRLVQSRGYTKFSRAVLQRMEKKAIKGDFFDACGAAVMSHDEPGGTAASHPAPNAKSLFKVRRGRKPNDNFETAVMGKLLFVTVVNAREVSRRKMTPLSLDDQRNRVKVDAAKKAERGGHMQSIHFPTTTILRSSLNLAKLQLSSSLLWPTLRTVMPSYGKRPKLLRKNGKMQPKQRAWHLMQAS